MIGQAEFNCSDDHFPLPCLPKRTEDAADPCWRVGRPLSSCHLHSRHRPRAPETPLANWGRFCRHGDGFHCVRAATCEVAGGLRVRVPASSSLEGTIVLCPPSRKSSWKSRTIFRQPVGRLASVFPMRRSLTTVCLARPGSLNSSMSPSGTKTWNWTLRPTDAFKPSAISTIAEPLAKTRTSNGRLLDAI
jgi:hypothetical protein